MRRATSERKIVVGDHVAAYVSAVVGRKICPPYTALGIERDGHVIAGVVFNSFTGPNVEATVAGERHAFTPAFIRRVGSYVFNELGCLRISITTEHEKVIDYARRLGAQVEGLKRNQFGQGRDGIILGILREDWKMI